MAVNGVRGWAQIQWDQDGGFTTIGRLPDVIKSEQWGSFCWVALTVCRLVWVEHGRRCDEWPETKQEEAFDDFGNVIEIWNWTVVGRICWVEVGIFNSGVIWAILKSEGN